MAQVAQLISAGIAGISFATGFNSGSAKDAQLIFPEEILMKVSSLHELLVEHLRDLYYAEKLLVKALPKMAKAAAAEDLREGFEEHLEQTEGHVRRLEQVFEHLDAAPRGKKCAAMEGLVEEGKEIISEDMDDNVRDAGLIAAAQKVEHYEIAAYGTARTWAEQLGLSDAVELLDETLQEEKDTDAKLTDLAQHAVNPQAEHGHDSEEETVAAGQGAKRGRNGKSRK
jgi:ferritin-like metal-binding protein YciE